MPTENNKKFFLSSKSVNRLQYAHPDLVKVVGRAIELTTVDFGVTESIRTLERQRELVEKGLSQTLKSRHLPHPKDGLSRAVDVVAYINGKVSWEWKYYEEIYTAMQTAADELRIPIVWGGNWKSFKDGPHYELDRKIYP